MYFISRIVDNKYGIVDTKDWVEEFYTEAELAKIKFMGIDVKRTEAQILYLNFLWSYWGITLDCGSSEMDIVDDYLLGNAKLQDLECGNSTKEVIRDLKTTYTILVNDGIDIDIRNLRGSTFYKSLARCLNDDRWNRSTSWFLVKAVEEFHLNREMVKKALYI